MARKPSVGSFIRVAVKISKAIDKANKRAVRAEQKAFRESERITREIERAHSRKLREFQAAEKSERREAQIRVQKEAKRIAALKKQKIKDEKDRQKYAKSLGNSLSRELIIEFDLGKKTKRTTSSLNLDITGDISQILKMENKEDERFRAKYGIVKFESFIFSGALNSVLGVDGLNLLRKILDGHKLNYDSVYTQSDLSKELKSLLPDIFRSGTYFLNESVSSDDLKCLSLLRYILKNTPAGELEDCDSESKVRDLVLNKDIKGKDAFMFADRHKEQLLSFLQSSKTKLLDLIRVHLKTQNENRLSA